MEILIILAGVIFVIALIVKSSSNQNPSTEQTSQHTAEQLRDRGYKISRQLAKLSTESSNIICNLRATDADMRRHEILKAQMAALEKEEESIKIELSNINKTIEKPSPEFSHPLQNHVKLVALLMKNKGFTEEQANTAILNKIETRKRQYQSKGLSEEQSLEKASRDVYRLIEKNPNT